MTQSLRCSRNGHTEYAIVRLRGVLLILRSRSQQAMVHELMFIEHNRVDMRSVPNVRPDLKASELVPGPCAVTDSLRECRPTTQEVVLSPSLDHFYKGSMLLNFGDLVSAACLIVLPCRVTGALMLVTGRECEGLGRGLPAQIEDQHKARLHRCACCRCLQLNCHRCCAITRGHAEVR